MLTLSELLGELFATNYQIQEAQSVIYGHALLNNQAIHLIGVKESTFLGAEQALIMAEKLIEIIQNQNVEPVLLLVDVAGQ